MINIKKLRESLRAHHENQLEKSEGSFTWKRLSEDIKADTGVSISAESLRRFVVGASIGGERKKPTLREEYCEAISKFLVNTQ